MFSICSCQPIKPIHYNPQKLWLWTTAHQGVTHALKCVRVFMCWLQMVTILVGVFILHSTWQLFSALRNGVLRQHPMFAYDEATVSQYDYTAVHSLCYCSVSKDRPALRLAQLTTIHLH